MIKETKEVETLTREKNSMKKDQIFLKEPTRITRNCLDYLAKF